VIFADHSVANVGTGPGGPGGVGDGDGPGAGPGDGPGAGPGDGPADAALAPVG